MLQYLSAKISEIDSVPSNPDNKVDNNSVKDLLNSLNEVKDEYKRLANKCKLLEPGNIRIEQLEKRIDTLEEMI